MRGKPLSAPETSFRCRVSLNVALKVWKSLFLIQIKLIIEQPTLCGDTIKLSAVRSLHARYHTDLHSVLPRDQKAIILCRETFLTKIFFLMLLPKAAPNLSKWID